MVLQCSDHFYLSKHTFRAFLRCSSAVRRGLWREGDSRGTSPLRDNDLCSPPAAKPCWSTWAWQGNALFFTQVRRVGKANCQVRSLSVSFSTEPRGIGSKLRVIKSEASKPKTCFVIPSRREREIKIEINPCHIFEAGCMPVGVVLNYFLSWKACGWEILQNIRSHRVSAAWNWSHGKIWALSRLSPVLKWRLTFKVSLTINLNWVFT